MELTPAKRRSLESKLLKTAILAHVLGIEGGNVRQKLKRLRQWYEDINRVQSDVVYDFVFVDEEGFEKYRPGSFRQLVNTFRMYKE